MKLSWYLRACTGSMQQNFLQPPLKSKPKARPQRQEQVKCSKVRGGNDLVKSAKGVGYRRVHDTLENKGNHNRNAFAAS